MNQHSLAVASPQRFWNGSSQGSCAVELQPQRETVVVVSWASADSQGRYEPQQLELAAQLGPSRSTSSRAGWVCRTGPERLWVDSIADSNCGEVVLTAQVGESGPDQQLVLELAGLLTRELERTKPLIRVCFLRGPERARRSRRLRR